MPVDVSLLAEPHKILLCHICYVMSFHKSLTLNILVPMSQQIHSICDNKPKIIFTGSISLFMQLINYSKKWKKEDKLSLLLHLMSHDLELWNLNHLDLHIYMPKCAILTLFFEWSPASIYAMCAYFKFILIEVVIPRTTIEKFAPGISHLSFPVQILFKKKKQKKDYYR